ncbi:hypothetical protein J3F83DRAFT_554634 [Trichoderma novae-zelandiae]
MCRPRVPGISPRGRQKQADSFQRKQSLSSPLPASASESREEQVSKSQQQTPTKSFTKAGDDAPNGSSAKSRQGSPQEPVPRTSPRENGIVARKDLSSTGAEATSTETDASEQSIDQYPVTQLVLNLEKREREAQDKYKLLEKKCHDLDSAVGLIAQQRANEKSDYEAKCKSLEAAQNVIREKLLHERNMGDLARVKIGSLVTKLAAHDDIVRELEQEKKSTKGLHAKNKTLVARLVTHDAMLQQLEEEQQQQQQQMQELQTKNESLVADLAAQAQEKDFLAAMLQEKTYESWIFRCAVGVIYKDTPSRDRVKLGTVIRAVVFHLRDKRQRELARQQQENDGNGQQGDQEQEQEQVQVQDNSEQTVESAPQHEEPCLATAGAGDSDSDSEDMPLSARAKRVRLKRQRVVDHTDYFAASDGTDDEAPLSSVLKQRAKKLKTTSSHEEASSAD